MFLCRLLLTHRGEKNGDKEKLTKRNLGNKDSVFSSNPGAGSEQSAKGVSG
jgi:hypothetical protein